jgi:hypothetical protein
MDADDGNGAFPQRAKNGKSEESPLLRGICHMRPLLNLARCGSAKKNADPTSCSQRALFS